MQERREWLRFGAVGVAALIGVPGDLVSLGLDRLFSRLDTRARRLSTHVAEALAGLARHHHPGTVESARLASEDLLARVRLSDAGFVALNLEAERAAAALLDNARFSIDERAEIEPLCRRLLVCFYQTILESSDLFAELLPSIHQEQLRRLGRIESKLGDVSSQLTELRSAITGDDRQLVQTLIDSQVDLARRLIETHRPHAAIELLQGILEVATDRLDARMHFRVRSNLGNAHLLLFDAQSAGLLFVEAAKYAPDDDDQAVAQHAHAHLLLGELDTAARIACEGSKRFQSSGRLQAMRLAIASRAGQRDPETAVPDDFKTNHHVAYTAAHIYAESGDMDSAVKSIKIAYEAEPNNWQTRKAYAEFLVARAVEHSLALRGGPRDIISDFKEGADELERIWEIIRAGEPIEASVAIAAQLAASRKLANDRDGARRACEAGFAMGGPLPTLLVQIAATLAEEDGRFDDAIGLLRQIDMARMPERDLLIASAQAALGRNDDAVKTLVALAENGEVAGGLRATARARSVEVRARGGADRALRDEALALAKAEPNVVAYRLVAAALHEELGEHEAAVSQARAARELLDKSSSLNDQIGVANLLLDLGEASDAAEVYAQLAPDSVDSAVGRQLLRSLFKADSRAELRARLDAMPAGEKTDPFYLWVEAALLERIGELEEATKLLETYLQQTPGAAGLRLTWIDFLERLDHIAQLRDFLGKNTSISNGTVIQQLRYAHILKRHGFTEDALRLGYETTRNAKPDPSVHLAYVALILFTQDFEPFDSDVVGLGQGFVFESEDGARRRFVIELGEPSEKFNSILPDHPIGQAAIGKRVGDVLEIEDGPYVRTVGHIVEVRHRYLVLNDDLMLNFNQRFPGHTGLFRVPIRGLEGSKPDVSELVRALEDLDGWEQSVSNQYAENRLPLPVIAKLLGEHPVRAWGKLSGSRDGIIVCDGNSAEIQTASQLLRATGGLMIDPIALNLIHELGIGEALVGTGLPLGVTRSTIDEKLKRTQRSNYTHRNIRRRDDNILAWTEWVRRLGT